MRIMFWNVYRLGGTTDQVRGATIVGEATHDYDVTILCELTPRCEDPPPLVYVTRRNKARQLCYAVISETFPLVSEEYVPAVTDEWKQAAYKGGSDFRRLVSRLPGRVRLPDGVDVYFFHAPASDSGAAKAVTFLACDLLRNHGTEKWIVVGDLNVEPDKLGAAKVGVDMKSLIRRPQEPTHVSPGGVWRTLDYALSNGIPNVTVTTLAGGDLSDHEPIVVQY